MESGKRFDIQYLRAFAVLLVVVHHAKADFFPNGYLGVDIFFVISGFLIIPKIANILESDLKVIQVSRLQKLKNFYLQRFLRLTPALSVFIIFNLILILGLGSVFNYKDNVFQSLLGLIGLGNVGSHTFAPDYFHSRPSSAYHLWSLSVEEQFYLLIPIFTLLLARIRIIIWLTMIGVLSFIAFLYVFQGNESNYFFISYYSPALRLWEFIFGGLIAINKLRLKKSPKMLILLFVIVIALLPQVKISERVAIVSIVLGTCIFLISDQVKWDKPLIENILAWIGDRSYSIYLYHLPLVFLTRHSPYINDFSRSISMSIALILTFVLGDLSFRLVEKKFNVKYSHRRALAIPVKLYVLAFLFTIGFLFFGSLSNWLLNHENIITLPKAAVTSSQSSVKDSLFLKSNEVLILGDSHANVISGGVSNDFKRHAIPTLNLSKNGCELILPSVLKKYPHSSNATFNACLNHNERVFKFVEQRGNPIIIAQRSTVYQPEGLIISDSDYRKVYFESTAKYLNLRNRILVIGPVPDWPREFSNIYQEVGVFQKVIEPLRTIPISEVRQSFRDSALLKLITLELGKKYGSSFDVFCDKFVCSRFAGGKWLYTDESHLSDDGVNLLIETILTQKF